MGLVCSNNIISIDVTLYLNTERCHLCNKQDNELILSPTVSVYGECVAEIEILPDHPELGKLDGIPGLRGDVYSR